MIKLQIIKGIHDRKTPEIFLREPDLTLTQCIDWCRAAEQSNIQSQKIEKYNKLNVGNDKYDKDSYNKEMTSRYHQDDSMPVLHTFWSANFDKCSIFIRLSTVWFSCFLK